MKLSTKSAELFAKEIALAKSKGMTHFAKAVGMPGMRFAMSEDEAVRLATNSAKRFMRSAKLGSQAPHVQAGQL